MDISYIKIRALKPYKKNPRKNDKAVEYVKKSIQEFGFKVPIVIDDKKEIVTGHTRLKAAKELGYKEVPCIIADDLTPDQIKAFRLADNKVSEIATWDLGLLDGEITDLMDLDWDMGDFGFGVDFEDFNDQEEDPDDDFRIEKGESWDDGLDLDEIEGMDDDEKQRRKEEYRLSLYNILNLGIANFEGAGPYDMPEIIPVKEIPEVTEWIGFNYVLSDKNPEGKGVHFFVDDYQFERVWNRPKEYVEKLKQYKCVLAPDFSPYCDMPLVTQMFNHYRKHWCAAYWQSEGITVIPTIRSSTDPRSLTFYLDGEPEGGAVAFSTMWAKEGTDTYEVTANEYKTMVERLKPSQILLYGPEKPFTEGEKGIITQIPTFAEKRWED